MSLAKYSINVDVKAKKLRRAMRFYSEKLGLKPLLATRTWAVFRVKGAELHLNVSWGTTRGIEFKVRNIAKRVAELKSRGVVFTTGIRNYPWGKIAHFSDSEGNTLALVEPKKH
jgi:predicted enzyme related to lactoylglutathione lyase